MTSNAETFVAHADERIYVPLIARPRDKGRGILAAAGAVFFYATLGCLFAIESQRAPATPPAAEIPVEIVVEPPPPPKEEAPPPQSSLDETPATDAPRAGTADRDTGDQEKEAKTPPPAAPTPEPTETPAAPAPTQAIEPTSQATPESTPQPTEEAPPWRVANGETPPPATAPPPAPQVASLEPPAPPKAEKTAPRPFFDSVPEIDFGGAAMRSPVTGGAAKASYLSILYGKIMPHFHKPADARSIVGHGRGAVVFSVDARGQLIDRWIVEESGYHALDRAAFDAVGAGAPYPPPPSGGEVRVRFEYSGG